MNQINWSDGRLWRPEIKGGSGPMYRRIADAIQADVGAGTLVAGIRLPTQRQLSADLGVSVGTANAAYLEAERRGFVRRRVGSGTFVASPGTRAFRPDGHINLAVNLPPFHACAPLIRDLLTQLVEDADAKELLGYPLFRADGRYATAASMWIARTTTMPLLPPREVIPCQGATQGMLAVMDYLFQRGDRIACEQVTYGGFKVVARLLGLRLHPIGQDAEGLCPDGLEKACRDNQVRGLLICPTHQNPTGATTSLRRREELLTIARRYDLRVVEDDVYGPLAGKDASPPAFAVLDRARTFYVASASKSLAPGLRAGWVVPPPDHVQGVSEVLHAGLAKVAPFGCPVLTAGAAPFGFLAFAKMCETRMADEVLASVKREAAARRDMALQILGSHVQTPLEATSLHLWIPAAANIAEAIYSRLVRQDIHPTPPDAPMVNCAPTGLRLCLGGPERSQDLESALHTVRAQLEISGESFTCSVP